jgi:L-fuconolactonase
VILDHLARPETDVGPPYRKAAGLFALARYENLFLKLTTHNVHDAPAEFLVRAVKRFGAERVAWGSNYPAAKGRLAELLAQGREALAKLSDAEREWIFSRTARSLYG